MPEHDPFLDDDREAPATKADVYELLDELRELRNEVRIGFFLAMAAAVAWRFGWLG